MRLLRLVLATAFVTVAFAGCISDAPEPADQPEAPMDLLAQEIPMLDGTALVEEVRSFSEAFPKRNANGPNHAAARDHLAQGFLDAGLVVARQPFTAEASTTSTPTNIEKDGSLENIFGIHYGRSRDQWIVIGGHYDVTDAAVYGAYDDGSGTIMTLQLARAFAQLETDKTIVFTMFDGEEQGLRGSRHMVGSLLEGKFLEELVYAEGTNESDEVQRLPEIFAMVDLDMFGINWPSQSPIYFDDNADVVRAKVDATRKDIGIPDEAFKFQGISLGRSDYAPFEDAGIPIAFFISAFEETCPYDLVCGPVSYPFWHRVDTVEGMELMAGGPTKLADGFANAGRLASELLFFLAMTEGLEIEVREEPATA